MRMYPVRLVSVVLMLAACNTDAGDIGEPSTDGTLVVSTSTEGEDPDQDGYLLTVDDVDSLTLAPTGTAEVDVAPGRHTLRLLGVAGHCAVVPDSPLDVDIAPRSTTPVVFDVSCRLQQPPPPQPPPPSPTTPVLAFESRGDIYVANTDGSNLRKLTSYGLPTAYARDAAWSPDASKIAFSKSDGQWGEETYVVDAGGGNQRRISPKGAYDATPAWSPDGSRIAVENRRDNTSGGQILVMNADGTNRVQLTTNRQPTSSPAWSPDGRRIAYVTYNENPGDSGTHIFVMNADGTNRVRLTNDEAYDSDPEWSPDGSRIVFSREGDLFVMDADGANLAPLTPAGAASGGSYGPAWSPDGLMIAFTRSYNCTQDSYGDYSCRVGIWVVSIAGGPMYELPLQAGSERGPSWRP
jgi:Tol biopolymer transport system component